MHIASKLHIYFNITTLTFNEIFPEELQQVMEAEEFTSILHRINTEMALELHENAKSIRKWFKIVAVTSIFIIGLLLLPILLQKSHRQSRLMNKFQNKVKEYLGRLNKKKYLRRNIEWKLIQDKKASQTVRTDRSRSQVVGIVNPASNLRIELVYESETSRLLNSQISMVRTRNQDGTTTSYTEIDTPSPPQGDLEKGIQSDVGSSPSTTKDYHPPQSLKNISPIKHEVKSNHDDNGDNGDPNAHQLMMPHIPQQNFKRTPAVPSEKGPSSNVHTKHELLRELMQKPSRPNKL